MPIVRRAHPVLAVATGAAIGSAMTKNSMAQQQQQQMYQQQTQAEINRANAEAQAARAEAQAAKAEAVQVQAQVQASQNIGSVQYTTVAEVQQQPVFLELLSPHIVNEADIPIRQNQIISVPMGAVVRLVRGSLTGGLGAPFQDYIEVEYNGRVGKISRLIVRVASSPTCVPAAIGTATLSVPPAVGT